MTKFKPRNIDGRIERNKAKAKPTIDFLKTLNGNKSGEFSKLIAKYEENTVEPRICWYPSAGTDFRALLFLNSGINDKFPASQKEPEEPNLFLFTDYFPWEGSKFLDNMEIYNDDKTIVTVEHIEELPKLNCRINSEIVAFPDGSSATNRVVFLKVKVNSNELGEFTRNIIYAFVENESFCAEHLLPSQAKIGYIIRIRYGNGFGGARDSGCWLINVLKRLQSEIFISDDHYTPDSPRNGGAAILVYPNLGPYDNPVFTPIRTITGTLWSNHGDVTWYLIS